MSRNKILCWLCALMLVVAAACSNGDSSESSAGDDRTPTDETAKTDNNDGDAEEPSEPAEPLFVGLDGTVTLLTETSGGGARPLLEWEPVEGADHYSAYLYAPNGDVYWVWTGRPTSVHVGGEPRLDDGVPGPSIADGMTWAVMAQDEAGVPLAVSEQRPIAP